MLAKVCRSISTAYIPRPGEGGLRTVAMLPGDGIGPEICEQVTNVFKAVSVPIQWEMMTSLNPYSDEDVQVLKRDFNAAIKGVYYAMAGDTGPQSANVVFRKRLNVFADVIHGFTIPGLETRHDGIDIVIVRENTEGEYSGLEHEVYPGVIESVKVITRASSERIARYAFEFAYSNNRKTVTAVHKANIMKLCDGEFLKATKKIAKEYPNIKYNEIIVDNCSMQLASNPQQFDVMVMPNLYGGIVGNIVCGLTGGPGVTPGCNIGNDFALFEQGTRHTARDLTGKNQANPTALLLSSVMMLRHIGLPKFAHIIQEGVFKTIKEKKVMTQDMGGSSSMTEYTTEVINNIMKSS